MSINTIFGIIWLCGFIIALFPTYKHIKSDFGWCENYHGDVICLTIVGSLGSWLMVLMHIWDWVDNYLDFKENNVPKISRAKCMRQSLTAWENEHIHGMTQEEAHNKSMEFMELMYGEWWQYKCEEPRIEHEQIMKIEEEFEQEKAIMNKNIYIL